MRKFHTKAKSEKVSHTTEISENEKDISLLLGNRTLQQQLHWRKSENSNPLENLLEKNPSE